MEQFTNYNKEELVYEDSVCIAILPKKGPSQGFIKVIPKQLCQSLSELSEEIVAQLFYVASYAATSVFEGLGAQGTNIIVNDGDFKKTSEYQLSLLVVPRKENDGLDFKWDTKNPSQEELESTKNRISEQTFMIGKEKKSKDSSAYDSNNSNSDIDNNRSGNKQFNQQNDDNSDDEEENYLVKHLIRVP